MQIWFKDTHIGVLNAREATTTTTTTKINERLKAFVGRVRLDLDLAPECSVGNTVVLTSLGMEKPWVDHNHMLSYVGINHSNS